MTKPTTKISLFSLALPILIEQVLRNFLGTVNVFMLGNYSDEAVAAVGVANQIISVVLVAFMMIANGSAVLINQYLGAERRQEAGVISMNAIGVGALLGGVVSVGLITLAYPILQLMGLDQSLIDGAAYYLQWVGGASIMISVSSVISVLFRCYGDAKTPMVVVMLINVVNVVGNYLVIFQPFPVPLTGIEGIGIVRFISETVGVVLIVLFLVRKKIDYFHLVNLWKIKLRTLGQITRIGLMSGAEGISYMSVQVITTSFLTPFGAAALSAKVYVNTIDYYAYVIGMSIGQATQIIAGQIMGAGKLEESYRFVNRKFRTIFLCNALFSTVIFLLHKPLMGLFTSSEEVIAMSTPLFALCIGINIGRALNHCFNYGLRASGFVFWPMISAICSIWLVNCGAGYLLSTTVGLGIIGLWIAMAADDLLRGAVAFILWRTKRWKKTVSKMQHIEEVNEDELMQTETLNR